MKIASLTVLATATLALGLRSATASVIWTAGPGDITFTKPANGDTTQAANQDRITSNVWITRAATKALFNAASEIAFNDSVDPAVSPADTEWAFSSLDGNPTFSYGQGAAQFGTLTFDHFEDSLGGRFFLQGNITTHAAVLHLITDNIYIDIQFTDWGGGGNGGTFTYTRAAAPVPEPASLSLAAAAALLLVAPRRSKAPATV